MLTYKQRYKPRTEREYTKSDLTVYDSAGNTALNTLKVYGKSEIVDGAIRSAGEGGSIEVRTSGKNLFGGLPFATALNNASSISTIDTVNKTVTFNHAPTADSDIIFYSGGFKENTVYSFILTGNVISAGYNTSLVIYYTDGTWQQITINSETKQTVKAASRINKTIKGFGLSYYGDALSILYYDECGIFEGDIAVSAYEPYNGTMAVFSTGTPLRGITGGARDVAEWDGSAGTVTKNCVEVDLGTLSWNYVPAQTRFYANLPGAKMPNVQTEIAKILNSRYTKISFNSITTGTQDKVIAGVDTGSPFVSIRDTDYTDATAFTTAMSGVMLIYELATPTTEQLTQTENTSIASLRTFDGTTHCTNNATTDMTVNYTIKVPTI